MKKSVIFIPVTPVTGHRMAKMGHLDTDLMMTPGFQLYFNQTVTCPDTSAVF